MAVPPLPVFVRNLAGRQLPMSWYMGLFQLPWLGRKALERGLVERLWRAWSPGWEPDTEALAAAVEAMRHPVRARNALGYYRALLRASPRQRKRTAQTLKLLRTELAVPTLVLAGADDGCIAPATFAGTARAGPRVRLEVLPGVGHFMHLEAPDAVAEAISCYLASLSR